MLSLSVMLRATSTPLGHRAAGTDDLLARCSGYRVDGPNGRIGTIRGIGYDAATGRPDHLHVCSGLFARRTMTVGVEEVASVDPIRRRVNVVMDMTR